MTEKHTAEDVVEIPDCKMVEEYSDELDDVLFVLDREGAFLTDEATVADLDRGDEETLSFVGLNLGFPVTASDHVWAIAAKVRERNKVTYGQVLSWAQTHDSGLTADMLHDRCIVLAHEDGSQFTFNDAIAIRVASFIVVFTEHHGYHVFACGDVQVRAFKRERTVGMVDWTKFSSAPRA